MPAMMSLINYQNMTKFTVQPKNTWCVSSDISEPVAMSVAPVKNGQQGSEFFTVRNAFGVNHDYFVMSAILAAGNFGIKKSFKLPPPNDAQAPKLSVSWADAKKATESADGEPLVEFYPKGFFTEICGLQELDEGFFKEWDLAKQVEHFVSRF
jgi:hypothetical protein